MNKFINKRYGIIYTLIMGLLLTCTFVSLIGFVYRRSEMDAFEKLRLEMSKQRGSISHQLTSDMETLSSMADIIGANYNSNPEYAEACKSFKPFGLCTDIGILVPGDVLITAQGEFDVSGRLSFEKEGQSESYISGRVPDALAEDTTVIRAVVPVTAASGGVKAVLIGTIGIQRFSDYYKEQLAMSNSFLAVMDADSGEFIIDTKDVLGQKRLSNLAPVDYKRGYSYKEFYEDIMSGVQGYTSFVAHDSEEFLYVCYDELGINDWRIMLAQRESVVLANVRAVTEFLAYSFIVICLILLLYALVLAVSARQKIRMGLVASEIRKSLLEINHRAESLPDALKRVTEFARARSAFVSDSYEAECHYIIPEKEAERFKPDEIRYFNEKLLYYTSGNRKKQGVSLISSVIKADRSTQQEMPDFYEFMKSHKIHTIVFDVIINNNSNMYVIGALNPDNRYVGMLLDEVAACFSMAVYNRKHLERTQHIAITDALTGTRNRMAFERDIRENHYRETDYACIYIDVNELNYYNNRFGHAAGDQMLKSIGEILMAEFTDSDVYRMGGDEFLILNDTAAESEIHDRLERAVREIEEMKYHVAVGVKFSPAGTSLEYTVSEAEKGMYEDKALYYQDKELHKEKNIKDKATDLIESGIKELNGCLSVMTVRYAGVFFVSLENDSCVRLAAPEFFQKIYDREKTFSDTVRCYINEYVKHEYHRAILTLLDYGVLKMQFVQQQIPEISYERIDGQRIKLKIYCINIEDNDSDCIWVFEKEE